MKFNGQGCNLSNLSRLSSAQSRAITPENFSGEKGRGGAAPATNQEEEDV